MAELNSTVLNEVAGVLSRVARVCEHREKDISTVQVKRALYGVCHVLSAALDVLEDGLSSTEQETLVFLAHITRLLVGQVDIESGLSEVLLEINARLQTEAASIFLLDPTTEELVLTYAASPVLHKLIGVRVPVGLGVVGWVVRNNEGLIVPSAGLEPRFFSDIDAHSGFTTQSMMCVPLLRGGRPAGAIEVLNKRPCGFNDKDITQLEAIAPVVADWLFV
ncbi:MAG: GAF domain-containing protein [Anaerolineae bacterium]|nr:GAF domain-containing protein [Anaerolineae bacterium]